MDKARILEEIRRTAAENGGVALGQRRFEEATGLSTSAWRGRHWRQWSDAVAEAGFAPNRPNERHEDSKLIRCLADLTRKLRGFPSYADVRMAREADKAFPTHHVFNKLGALDARVELVRRYAGEHADYRDVLEFLPPAEHNDQPDRRHDALEKVDGFVYLLKHAKHYKIGKTFSVPRRHREIALELPEKPDLVHVISTDDPSGIEAYWHSRFGDKRTNGEWFLLTQDDVRAFKRRKFM
jgi:hypothetical protein